MDNVGPYDNRITAFIDILGFSRDVKAISGHPGLLLSINAVLSHLLKCKGDLDRARQSRGVKHDARMTCFSDCVVLSYNAEAGAALRAIADAAFVGRVLLAGGYLPRGVITVGPLVHTEGIIFGDALIEAAKEEECRVDTPRIKLMPAFATILKAELAEHRDDGRDFFQDRGDGPFVHILGSRWPFVRKEREDRVRQGIGGNHIDDLYSEMHDALPVRFKNAPHERARNKIRWICDYINDAISEQGLSPRYKVDLGDIRE